MTLAHLTLFAAAGVCAAPFAAYADPKDAEAAMICISAQKNRAAIEQSLAALPSQDDAALANLVLEVAKRQGWGGIDDDPRTHAMLTVISGFARVDIPEGPEGGRLFASVCIRSLEKFYRDQIGKQP